MFRNSCKKQEAHQLENCYIMKKNKKWKKKVLTTTKNEKKQQKMNLQPKKIKKMEKYAMELTFGSQVGVEALSSDLHMARTREVPY